MTRCGLFISRVIAFTIICGLLNSGVTYSKQDSEFDLLRKMPADIIERIAQKGRPNSDGLVGDNRNGWIHVRLQSAALMYLIVAVAYNEEGYARDAWRSIDFSFRHQREEGNFESGSFQGKKPTFIDDLSGVSFWLADLCHAILVVQESGLARSFDNRIAILLPKIKRTAEWLSQYKERLKDYDAKVPNRLFYDANAFGFSGILLNDDKLKQTGREFLEAGLALQRADGVFVEKGGADTSYQAVSLVRLTLYEIRFPDKSIDDAIGRGIKWETGKIKNSGEVDVLGNTRTGLKQEKFLGRDKQVSYEQVILALLYNGVIHSDSAELKLAESSYEYITKKSGQ